MNANNGNITRFYGFIYNVNPIFILIFIYDIVSYLNTINKVLYVVFKYLFYNNVFIDSYSFIVKRENMEFL
jgi:hypothetical protein